MIKMIHPLEVVRKIEKHGSESLTHSERVFVVEVFRAAAITNRPEIMHVKDLIQKAHLEYCLRMSSARGKGKR